MRTFAYQPTEEEIITYMEETHAAVSKLIALGQKHLKKEFNSNVKHLQTPVSSFTRRKIKLAPKIKKVAP
jgi:hypothetical protein